MRKQKNKDSLHSESFFLLSQTDTMCYARGTGPFSVKKDANSGYNLCGLAATEIIGGIASNE